MTFRAGLIVLIALTRGCAELPADREARLMELSELQSLTHRGPVRVKRTGLCVQMDNGLLNCG